MVGEPSYDLRTPSIAAREHPAGENLMAPFRVLILATRVPVVEGDGTPSFVLDNALPLAQDFDMAILAPRVRESQATSRRGAVAVKRFAYMPRRFESLAEDAIVPQLGMRPSLWFQAVMLSAAMLLSARREIRTEPPDVIHAHWILPAGLVAWLLHGFSHTPYIVTSQGADVFRLEAAPLRWLKRRIVRRAARFVGVSADISHRFEGISANLETQPSGIDFGFWEQSVGLRAPEHATVLFVGRLASKKGVDVALRALVGIEVATLRIVGDGTERRRLEALADALGVRERVVFVGQKSRSEIAQEFRRATCVVIPSVTAPDGDRDGTPNVLGEAVAAGVPVIASRIAGLGELLIDSRTGLLHDPGDVEQLRYLLEQIIAEPQFAKRLAVEAKGRLRETLDLNRVAERYAAWYRSAAESRQPKG